MALAGHTLVLTARHPQNVEKAIGYLAVDPVAAFPGLGRKLPHYGKYSYLGFEGDRAGQRAERAVAADPTRRCAWTCALRRPGWRPAPGVRRRRAAAARAAARGPAQGARRTAADLLAEGADSITWRSWPTPPARAAAPGSEGHEAAAKYIADRFKAYGLAPGGDSGGLLPVVLDAGRRAPRGADRGERRRLSFRGRRPEWKDQSVLVTAHYDHLGLGWPDVHKGDEGKVHPGADDNASGVAVMLELAHALGRRGEAVAHDRLRRVHRRGGWPRSGRRSTSSTPAAFPIGKVIGAINLDTVGRLGDQRLSVIGTGTASEWQHIFRGASFVTGVESRNIPEAMQASDQVSFVQEGRAGRADLHRRPRRLPPAERHGRQDRRPGSGQGGDVRPRGRDLPGGTGRAADEHDRAGSRRGDGAPAVAACGRFGGRAGCGPACELRHGARLRVRGAGRARRRPRRRLAGREGRHQGRRRDHGDRRQARREPAGVLGDARRPSRRVRR